jgi:hypothetical protein
MSTALNLNAFRAPAKPSPVAPISPKADWQTLDVATLSPDLQGAYFEYKRHQDTANKARKAFEALMSAKLELPTHLALAFGYRFGNLSVAIVPAERPKSARAAMSLEQLVSRIV